MTRRPKDTHLKTQVSATVLLSGGIDSASCAHYLLQQNYSVDALFIDYGQSARANELEAAKLICKFLSIPFRLLSITGLAPSGPGELLGRNAFLLLVALFANRLRAQMLSIGVHSGTPYYDCSQSFIYSMDRVVKEHTDGRVSVVAPFVAWTKSDVFNYFTSCDLPLELTYSCETGEEPPCGSCVSCCDRRALGC